MLIQSYGRHPTSTCDYKTTNVTAEIYCQKCGKPKYYVGDLLDGWEMLACQCGANDELAKLHKEIERLKKLVTMQSLDLSMLRHAEVWKELAEYDNLSDEALTNFENKL